jgi:hypothetical protein
MWNWLRYSGFSVILTGNPLHWRLIPMARREPDSPWDANTTWSVGWLFLTVRVWIDDGSW